MNIHISKVEDNIRPEMRHTIEIYDPAMPHEAVTSAWDDTQRYVSGSSDDGTPGRSRLLRLKLLVFGAMC